MTPYVQGILLLHDSRLVHSHGALKRHQGLSFKEGFVDNLALSTYFNRLHISEEIGDFNFIETPAKEICSYAWGGVNEIAIVRIKEIFHGVLGGNVDVLFEKLEVVICISINDRDPNIRIRMMLLSGPCSDQIRVPNRKTHIILRIPLRGCWGSIVSSTWCLLDTYQS